jgi:hypothetical protein
MARQLQLRRGDAAENNSFTGASGEITFDTTNNRLRVHNGSQPGGYEIPRSNEVVHNSGTENINGVKTIIGADTLVRKFNTKLDGENHYNCAVVFKDSEGTTHGYLRNVYTESDSTFVDIQSTKLVNGTQQYANVGVGFKSDGTVYTQCPEPSSNSNTNEIATTKFVNDKISTLTIPAGLIAPYGGSSAPTGWLMCNGQAVSRTTYATLYSKIGVNYGSGDGSTTFNLPNYTNRVAQGLGYGYVEAGLPNITAKWNQKLAYWGGYTAEGAVYTNGEGGAEAGVKSASYGAGFTFDASRSSSIYSNNVSTVQPASVKTYWIIKY